MLGLGTRATHPRSRLPRPAAAVSLILVGGLLGGCAAAPQSSASDAEHTDVGSASPSAGCTEEPVGCLERALADAYAVVPFNGVVAVERNGETVFERAYGTTGDGAAYEIDSSFTIASIGKMFTAVAVAQLADAGDLSFDDPVGAYVDGLEREVAAATVGELLSHTSGLGESIEDGIVSEVGTWSYTNAGYDLLARTVEAVSGQPFDSYLDARVFEPAGMSSTQLSSDREPGDPQGWGGETSTAGDLLRFADALVADRLVSAESTELLMTSKVETDHGGYGYGFEVPCTDTPHLCAGHFGVDGPFIGLVEISRDLGYTIVALCDADCDAMGPALVEFAESLGISI